MLLTSYSTLDVPCCPGKKKWHIKRKAMGALGRTSFAGAYDRIK